MRFFLWFIVVLALAACEHSTVVANPHDRAAVWIDTDVATGVSGSDVDDGIALIQAFHSPEFAIRGISAVFGNAPLEKTFPMAQKVAKEFGTYPVPVYRGARAASEIESKTEASQALADRLRQEHLTILAIGPLTNIAAVLLREPRLRESIDEIVIVAGRRPAQHFLVGESKVPLRDFNFELDPRAFDVIENSKVPMTLVPFEISSKVWITEKDLTRWERGTAATQWLARASRPWLAMWRKKFSAMGFNPFDSLAVAYLTSPQWVKCESLPVAVQFLPDDIDTKQRKPYLLASRTFLKGQQHRYCFEVSPEFKEDLMRRLMAKTP